MKFFKRIGLGNSFGDSFKKIGEGINPLPHPVNSGKFGITNPRLLDAILLGALVSRPKLI